MITSWLVLVNTEGEHYFVLLFLNLWDMRVDWIAPVKNSIVTCHGLAAHSNTHLPLKITRMQHVYEVYGNKINKAFVKRIIYIYIYIYTLKVTEIENVENVLWQLPLYHTFPKFLFVLVIPSLLVTLCHHEILSHPLWRN